MPRERRERVVAGAERHGGELADLAVDVAGRRRGRVKPTPCRPSSAHTGAFEERICLDRLESSETACSGFEVEP